MVLLDDTTMNPRHDRGVKLATMFPSVEGQCGYCGGSLSGRKRRWCSDICLKEALHRMWIRKGSVGYIRSRLFERDGGKCAGCGSFDEKWQADHIVAVVNGGGGCDLPGYQTLCPSCHKAKTKEDVRIAKTRAA